MSTRRLLVSLVFTIVACPVFARAQGAQAKVLVCNDTRDAFEIAVDDGQFMALPRSSCVAIRVQPGTHLVVPRGDTVGGPWFSEAAWRVNVGNRGGVWRFNWKGQVVDLAEVLDGFPAPRDPAALDAPVLDPLYIVPSIGLPLSAWYVCVPRPILVQFDGVDAFYLAARACGTVLAPVGPHALGFFLPGGRRYCPRYAGQIPTGGQVIDATPHGAVPGHGGRRPLPPTQEVVRARPNVREMPAAEAVSTKDEGGRQNATFQILGRPPARTIDLIRRGTGWRVPPPVQAGGSAQSFFAQTKLREAAQWRWSRSWSGRPMAWRLRSPSAFNRYAGYRSGARRPRAWGRSFFRRPATFRRSAARSSHRVARVRSYRRARVGSRSSRASSLRRR